MPRPEMTTMERTKVGFAAAVGGIAPNILYIAMCLTGEQRKDPGVNAGYVVGLTLLAGLGFLVAWLWNERVPQRAFYLGIGLPAMLQIAMSNPTQQAAPRTADVERPAIRSIASLLSMSAFAQAAPQQQQQQQPPVPAKTVTIAFKNVPTDARLVFMNVQGQVLEQVRPDWERLAPVGRVTVRVPDSATEIEIVSAFARNAPDEKLRLNVQTGTFDALTLKTESDFVAGFLRALGRPAADSMKLSPARRPSNRQ